MARLFWSALSGPAATGISLIASNLGVVRQESAPVATGDVVPAGGTPGASGSETGSPTLPGYVSRVGYVNAASSRVGTVFGGVQLLAAPTAWTSADQIPPGDWFDFWGTGSGGGGASGRTTQSTTSEGAASGAGAAAWRCRYSRAELIAELPIAFNIPLGGAGGPQIVSTVSVAANPGGNGATASCVGASGKALWSAGGGGGARGGVNTALAGGSGGGIAGDGVGGDSTAGNSLGGLPALTAATSNEAFGGAGSATSTGGSRFACWGGGSGGANSNGSNAGGQSLFGCGAGGSSRNGATAGPVATAGEDGGMTGALTAAGRGGGALGGAGSTVGTGQPGQDGADGIAYLCGGEGGGGGGIGVREPNGTVSGGPGGRGGFPGGGGGAGGSALTNGLAQKTAREGGRAGDALLMITGNL